MYPKLTCRCFIKVLVQVAVVGVWSSVCWRVDDYHPRTHAYRAGVGEVCVSCHTVPCRVVCSMFRVCTALVIVFCEALSTDLQLRLCRRKKRRYEQRSPRSFVPFYRLLRYQVLVSKKSGILTCTFLKLECIHPALDEQGSTTGLVECKHKLRSLC